MPKNGFPMPTAENGFHILNLHSKKNMYLTKYPFLNANLLEKFRNFIIVCTLFGYLFVYFMLLLVQVTLSDSSESIS